MSATAKPDSASVRRLTVTDIARMHADGERIPMLTAYDYPTAKILDEAGIPMLLVGDSLGRAMLGYENELSVTMEDMLHHAAAVTRGARHAVVVGDMPFLSYATSDDALRNAGRFVHDASVQAVKVEGGVRSARTIETLVKAGIPVMGHIGLTPQSANAIGKFRVQGKTRDQARALLHDALAVQEAGAFSVVLELVPEQLAAAITERLGIPTIGIGAGAGCSGQVQIITDLLGLDTWQPKHARPFVDLHAAILGAVKEYAAEVGAGTFPGPEQTVRMDDDVLDEVLGRSPLDAAGGRHIPGDMPAGGIPLDRDL
jgi:3-methyl-2-oxobutanoate hydroxymethyltransferase